ncbi:hypothetical protein T484DRAFT_1821467 [Baffinella frigidus]|nr:hypothetical protein T484DRAFT_1821467 [Cryptophyta sp. CCMP2293]
MTGTSKLSVVAVCGGLILFAFADMTGTSKTSTGFGMGLQGASVVADAFLPNLQQQLFDQGGSPLEQQLFDQGGSPLELFDQGGSPLEQQLFDQGGSPLELFEQGGSKAGHLEPLEYTHHRLSPPLTPPSPVRKEEITCA